MPDPDTPKGNGPCWNKTFPDEVAVLRCNRFTDPVSGIKHCDLCLLARVVELCSEDKK